MKVTLIDYPDIRSHSSIELVPVDKDDEMILADLKKARCYMHLTLKQDQIVSMTLPVRNSTVTSRLKRNMRHR